MGNFPQIIALGARTPVGLSAEAAAAAVRAGISRLREWPYLVGPGSELLIGARDPLLDPTTSLVERLVVMALAALREVAAKIPGADCSWTGARALLALPEERVGFSAQDAAQTMSQLSGRAREVGLPLSWQQVGRGHAGGVAAMQRAVALIERREVELCFVGGVDSYLHPQTLSTLLAERQLAAAGARDGFPPGEAAAFVLVAGPKRLSALRVPSLGSVRGAHVSQESNRFQDNDVCRADGLTEAVSVSCESLNLPQEAPGMVFCDINGQRFRSEEWGLMHMRIGQLMPKIEYQTAVSAWGDVGAASAPLLLALACRSWARGYAEDRRALIWCASPAGTRGAVALEAPNANLSD